MDYTATGQSITEDGDATRAAAFRSLAELHLDESYRLARAILHDPSEAEDATHDAFIVAWQKWMTLRDRSRFEPWFRKILINTCRNHLRRGSRWHLRDISNELSLASADDFTWRDERDAIGRAVQRLGPDDRILLALRYDRDMTVDSIADALGIPSGTVKSRLHVALRRMQAALEPTGARESSHD